MRIGISDIDGCLGDFNPEEVKALIRKEIPEAQELTGYPALGLPTHLKYGVHSNEVYRLLQTFQSNEFLCMGAFPIKENITAMQQWALEGWVPGIASSRSGVTRIATESWLAKHNVPYSNLAFNDTDFVDDVFKIDDILYYLDADFYVTASAGKARIAASYTGVRTYLIETTENKKQIEANRELMREKVRTGFENVYVVKSMSEVTGMEKQRG